MVEIYLNFRMEEKKLKFTCFLLCLPIMQRAKESQDTHLLIFCLEILKKSSEVELYIELEVFTSFIN